MSGSAKKKEKKKRKKKEKRAAPLFLPLFSEAEHHGRERGELGWHRGYAEDSMAREHGVPNGRMDACLTARSHRGKSCWLFRSVFDTVLSFSFRFLNLSHAVVRVRDCIFYVVLLPEVLPDVSGCTVLRASVRKTRIVLRANWSKMHHFACGLEERAPFSVQPSKSACTVLRATCIDMHRFACSL